MTLAGSRARCSSAACPVFTTRSAESMSLRRALPRVCIALGFPDVESLVKHAACEIDAGERFFEFRLDYLPDPEAGVQAISDFLKRYPEATILATCRRHQNQGRYNGSIEEQIRILSDAVR